MLISGANNRVSDWPFPLIQFDLHFFLKNWKEKPMHLIHSEESQKWLCTSLPGVYTWESKSLERTSAVRGVFLSTPAVVFFYYSFPGQGLALSTETAPQSISLPHHCSLHPAMTGTEGGACPASHLPPLPSKKATDQALLFFCLHLKAVFSFNHRSVISLVSLPALHWSIQSSKRRGRAAIPHTGEQRQAGGKASGSQPGPRSPWRRARPAKEERWKPRGGRGQAHGDIGRDYLSLRPPRGLTTAGAGSWLAFSCSGGQTLNLPFAREKKGGAGKENWPHLRQRVL